MNEKSRNSSFYTSEKINKSHETMNENQNYQNILLNSKLSILTGAESIETYYKMEKDYP